MALTKIPSSLLDTSGGFDLQGNITLGDNERIQFGDGTDFEIYSDGGSNNYLISNNGALILRNLGDDKDIYLQSDDGSGGFTSYIHAKGSTGEVILKHYGSNKIATSSAGATVTGTLTVTGDLDITGDINSYNVTDLDVTDQTITLGAGQTEANSGGSGIIIDGSSASILWDETNTEFDINNPIHVAGGITFGTSDSTLADNNIRFKSTGAAYIDHNTVGQDINFRISNASALDTTIMTLDAGVGSVGINQTSPSSTYKLDVGGAVRSTGNAPSFNLREDDSSNQHWQLGSYGGVFALRNVTGGAYPLQSSGGQVGIGMAPNATKNFALDIQATSGGNALRLKGRSAGGNEGWLVWTDNSDNVEAGIYATSNNLIFANTTSYTERMRIDSSGNVGINRTPAAKLDVNLGASGDIAIFRGGDSDTFTIESDGSGILLDTRNTTTGLTFQIQGANKMKLDTSGNFLVGTTSTTVGAATSGYGFRVDGANGIVQAAASGNISAIFNRTSNDGAIVSLRKNGSEVGSIGTEGTELTIGTTTAGLQFLGSEGKIRPFNMSTNSASNGVVDLGRSNAKFKDLYLSGAIKMDSDLDDYEEGTWTPAMGGATLSTAVGKYTKIGNQVTVYYHLVSTGSMPTSTANVIITGLPFTSNSGSLFAAPIYARYYTPNDSSLTSIIYDNETQIRLMNINDQSFDFTIYGELEASYNNSVYIIGTATYIV